MYRDVMFCVRCGVWQQDRPCGKMTMECKGTKNRTCHYFDVLNKLRHGIFPKGPFEHWPGPFGTSRAEPVQDSVQDGRDVEAAPVRKQQLPPATKLALCDR